MTAPSSRIVVPLSAKTRAALDLPFRVGDQAFSPQADPILRNDNAAELCLIAGLDAARLSLETTIDLRGAQGEPLPLATSGPIAS